MNATNREYVCQVRSSQVSAWMVYSELDQQWTVETIARTKGGIRYLRSRHAGEQPPNRALHRDALVFGQFSSRPCQLGRPFDATMTHAAMALLIDCCRVRRYDIEAILRTAFPETAERSLESVQRIVAQAQWEGLTLPTHWTAEAVRQLLVAIEDTGYTEILSALGRLPIKR